MKFIEFNSHSGTVDISRELFPIIKMIFALVPMSQAELLVLVSYLCLPYLVIDGSS